MASHLGPSSLTTAVTATATTAAATTTTASPTPTAPFTGLFYQGLSPNYTPFAVHLANSGVFDKVAFDYTIIICLSVTVLVSVYVIVFVRTGVARNAKLLTMVYETHDKLEAWYNEHFTAKKDENIKPPTFKGTSREWRKLKRQYKRHILHGSRRRNLHLTTANLARIAQAYHSAFTPLTYPSSVTADYGLYTPSPRHDEFFDMECRALREARYERNSDGEWMVHERRESGFQVPRCTVVGGEGVGRCKCWVQAEREQVREQRGVEMMWEWKVDLEDEAGREEERQQMGLEMMGMWKVGLESVVVLDEEEERGDEVEWRDPDEVAVMAAGPGGFWMAEMEGEVEGVVVEEVEDVAVEAEAAGDGWEWEILWGLAAWIIDEDDFA